MKSAVTSVDCLALALEAAGFAGARFEKAWQPSPEEVVLRLRAPGQGAREWRVTAGRWAFLSQGTREWPDALTPFAVTLRSRLEGARLAAVRQAGFDRVLELEFAGPQGTATVACELFGDGNVVLVREAKVVQALRFLRVAHRTVAPGEPWLLPPARVDPSRARDEELEAHLLGSRADAVRTLAVAWNLGGPYAEEVCARAGVAKHARAAGLGPAERGALVAALRGLLAQVRERPEPVLVRDGERLVDATPVPLVTLEEHSFEARSSFHEALEEYVAAWSREQRHEDPRLAALREERERLERVARAQEESLAGFERGAEEQRALGDLLYARYQEVEALLARARERRRSHGPQGFEVWPREAEQPAPFRVLRADPAEGLLEVELGGRTLTLRLDADVRGNAERCYEEAKRLREKAVGARAAIEDTLGQLERLGREGARLADELARERARRRFEPTKRLWFEAYRWFVSSEGHLVLGGRDAGSNERLVKRHLEPSDRYVHADLQGAPSVVVKRGRAPAIGEATLREAAEFAVAWSKAWAQRVGSADAYWVTPEQVSKSPEAGEHLARGAFVIRGKRNFLNCALRAAVGECEVEGQRKVMGGPVAALRARARRLVVLEPGEGDANALARELGEAFRVPVEEVQAVLPPGPARVVERVGL